MTKELKQVFREAADLPESKQNVLAGAIRSELTGDKGRDQAIAASRDVLDQLADEAVKEHRSG